MGKQQKNGRAKSTRPSTVIRPDSSQNQLTIINQTAFVGPADTTVVTASGHHHNACHESFLRDYQTNQSNTVIHDVSLLSKIGTESKGHLNVAHYGTATGGGMQSHNGSILINQSSQQNLQPHASHEALGVKSAGKRIGLSRASIETSSSVKQPSHTQQQSANQSQVLNAPPSGFAPASIKDTQAGSSSGTMQISQKAMKIISSQKSKISGAQRQVQMEWKSSGV